MKSRVLASIQTIKSAELIPNADAIVKVNFVNMFWTCVMKKPDAIPGKRVVYFEIDSLLPKDRTEFNFMAAKGWKVKTIKLKGQISQGLALPFSELPDLRQLENKPDGFDLTTELGVRKYEAPEDGDASSKKKPFPSFIQKTDEERAQNMKESEMAAILTQHDLHATVKLDGSSATFYLFNGEFGVCSRNLDFGDGKESISSTFEESFFDMARTFGIEERLRSLNRNISIQGEIIGPDFNGNRVKHPHVDLFIFTAQDLDKGCRMTHEELIELVRELNNQPLEAKYGRKPAKDIKLVPYAGLFKAGTLKGFEDLLKVSEGTFIISNAMREGLVFRHGRDISFKMINPKYLLKNNI